ncbi:U5 small nuclear ribonucleoprotein 200 kDa helicase [Cryptosporidium felis]|nr:U5 small nuclear ribonucleoprotein 200 kDa helicase [Cryptosporidium felis]
MMDDFEKSKRFGYKANSNLVIQTTQRIREDAPTGEAESLAGRIKYRMGDLAIKRSKPKIKETKQLKKKVNKSIVSENDTTNILDLDLRNSGNTYRPTTMETRLAYDELLGIITGILGSQPSQILDDVVFELLAILKNDELRDDEKRAKCKEIIIDLSIESYGEIVEKSRRLTDFTSQLEEVEDEDDETQFKRAQDASEVAVIFDESDAEKDDDEYNNEDKNDSDSDSDSENDDNYDLEEDTEYQNYDEFELEREEAERYMNEDDTDLYTNRNSENREPNGYIRMVRKEELSEEDNDPDKIDIGKLDAYWLQRELYSIFQDADRSLEVERELIQILASEDDQECENSLVILFNYENFDWIKKLLKNRWNIYYCTIIGQARSDSQREKIIDEMRNTKHGSIVLDLLSRPSTWKSRESDFFKSISKYIQDKRQDENLYQEEEFQNRKVCSKKYTGKFLDLDKIYREQGLNSSLNTRVTLPKGSERIENTDYDSITIPPIRREIKEKSRLISVDELPEWSRECFSCVSISHLNEIQSKVFNTAFYYFEDNLLVCAPTGSGKTNIAMLCILNVISQFITSEGNGKFSLDVSKFKIVYISPMKALVSEQVESLRIRLKPLNVSVNEMTGDTRISRSLMEATQVFVTTPEKFDIITRKSTDGLSENLRLIIIDEIHMLHDSRGSVLEGIVARFKNSSIRMVGLSATLPNFIDVAEFLNVDPVRGLYHFGPEFRPVPLLQTFIGIKTKKGFKKLQLMNDIVYDLVLEDISKHQILVFVHSRKETIQTARFIRDKATEKGALGLFFSGNNNVSREIILDELKNINSNILKEILPSGIGIHHAGLSRSDRKIVEDLFSDSHLRVLVTTATLAWGVNLPAHTVIIKGTQVYQAERGEWTELSPLDMLQMIGRGGRPQYDDNGHGIIITDFDHLTFYLSLLNQQLNIESQLIPKLPDLINAEIVLGTLQTREDVLDWIRRTFLYIRIRKNPILYGLDFEEIFKKEEASRLINLQNNTDYQEQNETAKRDPDLESQKRDLLKKQIIDSYLLKLVETALDKLETYKLIHYDFREGKIASLTLGKISSHFYLSPETIQDLDKQLLPNLSDIQLFRLFSTCKEFKFLLVRNEEKIELEKLVDKVPIPIQGVGLSNSSSDDNIGNMIDLDVFTKVNVLLQIYLTGSKWVNSRLTLLSDLHYIVQSAPRIFRAIFTLSIKRRWPSLAKRSLKIATMIERRSWEAMLPLRQFKGISEEVVKRLERKDLSWNKYYDFTSNQLGEMLKSAKLGPVLFNLIRKIPRLEISATVYPIDSKILQIDLVVKPNFIWDCKIHGQSTTGDINTEKINTGETFWILIEDSDGEYLYLSDMIIIRPSFSDLADAVEQQNQEIRIQDDSYYLSYQIFLDKKYVTGGGRDYNQNEANIIPPYIFVRSVADKWLHSETSISIPIGEGRLILPEDNGVDHTELLDLHPISVKKAFSGTDFDVYLREIFQVKDLTESLKLNGIQTQLFNLIYHSNKSFYLSSPPGNGQFVCTCMGILREMNQNPDFKSKNFQVLYLTCNKERTEYITSKLERIFGTGLVGSLQKTQKNPKSIEFELDSKSILVSDIETWDRKVGKRLSKVKQLVQKLSLLIIDNIEFLNFGFRDSSTGEGGTGAIIESAISRLRYIITPLGLEIRIFAYSKSISNANEVSEWLGIPKASTFSFDQNIFNDGIVKKVIGFDSYYRSSRLQMMLNYIKDNKIIQELFTEFQSIQEAKNRKQTLLIFTLEYEICFGLANEISLFALSNKTSDNQLHDYTATLEFIISVGVGMLYGNQPKEEKARILSLYSEGKINIIVASEDMKNSITFKFDHVIVMDTNKLDYDENKGSVIGSSKVGRKTMDYSHLEIHQMLSRCKYYNSSEDSNSDLIRNSSFTLLCSTSKEEFYKHVLKHSLPIESSIDSGIIDCLNTEIALRTVKTKQDTIDWVTWTLFYRRILKNPSYYGLTGNTSSHISDFLSEYFENLLDSLSEAKCIQIEERGDIENEGEDEIVSLNLSLISAFYNLRVSTVEYLSKSMNENETYGSLIKLIVSVPQLQENCIVRKGDIPILTQLGKNLELNLEKSSTLSSIKAEILLNSYLRREKLVFTRSVVRNDLVNILREAMDLIFAMVDISSSFGWTNVSLRIMELSQMLVQAVVDPINEKLLQLGGMVTTSCDQIKVFKENGVSDIYDLINLEENERSELLIEKLGFSQREINEIAQVCNDFPIFQTDYTVLGCEETSCDTNKRRRIDLEKTEEDNHPSSTGSETSCRSFECLQGSDLTLIVDISRDLNENVEEFECETMKREEKEVSYHSFVRNLKFYPLEKEENWWVLLLRTEGYENESKPRQEPLESNVRDGDYKILGIKRVQLNKVNNQIKLKLPNCKEASPYNSSSYKLLVISDSFIGCDQEFKFTIRTVSSNNHM